MHDETSILQPIDGLCDHSIDLFESISSMIDPVHHSNQSIKTVVHRSIPNLHIQHLRQSINQSCQSIFILIKQSSINQLINHSIFQLPSRESSIDQSIRSATFVEHQVVIIESLIDQSINLSSWILLT
jgi:hypothetical protein